MVKIVESLTKKLTDAELNNYHKQEEEWKEKLEKERPKYLEEIKHNQLLAIINEEIPKSYLIKEWPDGQFLIYEKVHRLFRKSKNVCIGGIYVYKSNSIMEDEIHANIDDANFIEIAKKVATRYEKIKGREMQIRLTN